MNWKPLNLITILILVVPVFGSVSYDDIEPSVTNTWSWGTLALQWKDAFGDGTLDWDTITDGILIITGGLVIAGTWQGVAITVPYGGTGATSLTDGGLLVGSGTSAITALGVAANGQIPIGDGTTDPVLATITGGTNLTTVNGAGSITLNVDDAFLINDGDDTTTGTLTAGGFTTAGTTTTDVLIIGSNPPASASSVGTAGMITRDSDYIYICVAANTWAKVAIASWGVPAENVIYAGENVIYAGEQVVYP